MCGTDRPEKAVAGIPRKGERDLTHVELGCRVGLRLLADQ
jgi:hypothetical protein